MSALTSIVDRVRGFDLEARVGLRAAPPRLVIELDASGVTVVRLAHRRRGRPLLEHERHEALEPGQVPTTIFETGTGVSEALAERLRGMLEAAGRSGRVGFVLPDNLAKVSLLALPERPASKRELEEIIHFKTRRSVPFRLTEATLSYQVLPGSSGGIRVLVAVLRRGLVEGYEHVAEAAGARVGLVDLCTPNLLNLCRQRIDEACAEGDVALVNCAAHYFSLVIVRQSRIVFFRCKTFAPDETGTAGAGDQLAREIAGSFSYYQEKLAGQGIGTVLVRSVVGPLEEVGPRVAGLEAGRIEMIDPLAGVDLAPDRRLEPAEAQRLAPAIGAALGRS